MVPYFVAINSVNYARWIIIHLRDMTSLEQQHPDVAKKFHYGNFAIHMSRREFSTMAIDQAHEHNNVVIKGNGGAIRLTEDPSEFRRKMVAGPEVCRLLAGYEAMSGVKDATYSSRHHEQTPSVLKSFFGKVKSLPVVMQEMGNPIQEKSADLIVLDTKNNADLTLAEMVATHYRRGKEHFISFMKWRLFISSQNRQCDLEYSSSTKTSHTLDLSVTTASFIRARSHSWLKF